LNLEYDSNMRFERLGDICRLAPCHIPEDQVSSFTPLWKARNLHTPVYWATISTNSKRRLCNIAVVNLSVPAKVRFIKLGMGENFSPVPRSVIAHTDVFCFLLSYLDTHRFQTFSLQFSHLYFGVPAIIFPYGFPRNTFFTVLLSDSVTRWPAHSSLLISLLLQYLVYYT
jgi:hypothetical protein